VVAVARRLDRLLPSQWQERVKSHDTITFDEWLRRVLGTDTEDREHRRFWASHDLVAMADRWTPYVGSERFSLVVADEDDRDVVPRAFERMLGLPAGLLVLPPAANASLSANATELVRRVNELFESQGWPDETYHRLVQQGAVQQMTSGPRPASEGAIPPLPGWAAARVAELSDARIEQLRARGVPVIGDLEGLRVPAPQGPVPESPPRPEVVSIDTAVRAMAGLVEATIVEVERKQRKKRKGPDTVPDEAGPDGRSGDETPIRGLARRVAERVRRTRS
jgi:hypothetical protein